MLLETQQEYIQSTLDSFTKTLNHHNFTFLSQLSTEGFDLNQIWEQISLQNNPAIEHIEKFLTTGTELIEEEEMEDSQEDDTFLEEEDSEEIEEVNEVELDEESVDEELEELEEYEEELEDNEREEKTKKRSVVDDDFFSLEEMEKFADLSEAQDAKMAKKASQKKEDEEESSEDDDMDMFSIGKDLAEGDFDFDEDEDNANDINYEEFFGVKEKEDLPRKNWQSDMHQEEPETVILPIEEDDKNLLLDEEESEHEEDKLSKFERNQKRLNERIARLESENMNQKTWAMRGEVGSKGRPLNSLLEQDLDVEIAAKPVPVITEETTATLADLIIQRIKDSAFDDVERKVPLKDSVYDPNRRWELDDEKNKKSLADIYEDEYKKKALKEEVKSVVTIALEKQHLDISTLFDTLSRDLDALSNYHFTPAQATLELVVIPNASVPAISLEDVIPATISTAKLAIPREVYDGKVAKSQAELDSQDKKRLRTKSKRKASDEKKEREKAKKMRAGPGEMQQQITKSAAIKKLMNQRNVTLVVNSKDKKALGEGQAKTIEKGGKIGKDVVVSRPEMLKL